MQYKIEKNIPIPVSGKANLKYDFIDDMEVGDSVFFGGKKSTDVSHVLWKAKKSGKAFTCRTIEGGVRIWRIK